MENRMVNIKNLNELLNEKSTIIIEDDFKVLIKQNEDKDYEYEIYKLNDDVKDDYPIDNGIVSYDEDENLVDITNKIMTEVINEVKHLNSLSFISDSLN